jgi:hypothetical protein
MPPIIESITTLIVFGSLLLGIIAILNFIIKMRILNSGVRDEQYVKLLTEQYTRRPDVLKWGLLLLSGGIGLIVNHFIPGAMAFDTPLPYGIEAIFLALGLLVFHFMIEKKS